MNGQRKEHTRLQGLWFQFRGQGRFLSPPMTREGEGSLAYAKARKHRCGRYEEPQGHSSVKEHAGMETPGREREKQKDENMRKTEKEKTRNKFSVCCACDPTPRYARASPL